MTTPRHPLELRRIGAGDTHAHEAFLQYVPRVFPGVDFRLWHERGGWQDGYTAWALFDGDEIVANVSVAAMPLVVRGRSRSSWQLGAVGVVPERRGQGLQRRIMAELLAAARSAEVLVFLFANERVLDFYPRFGFARLRESAFAADVGVSPSGPPLPRLDFASPEDRARLASIAARARPVSERFAALRHGPILLWYGCAKDAPEFRLVPEHDALVVVRTAGTALAVLDVLAAQPFPLEPLLPRLATAPVARLEFGFTPELWWPSARAEGEPRDGHLFVDSDLGLGPEPFRFPVLAQT